MTDAKQQAKAPRPHRKGIKYLESLCWRQATKPYKRTDSFLTIVHSNAALVHHQNQFYLLEFPTQATRFAFASHGNAVTLSCGAHGDVTIVTIAHNDTLRDCVHTDVEIIGLNNEVYSSQYPLIFAIDDMDLFCNHMRPLRAQFVKEDHERYLLGQLSLHNMRPEHPDDEEAVHKLECEMIDVFQGISPLDALGNEPFSQTEQSDDEEDMEMQSEEEEMAETKQELTALAAPEDWKTLSAWGYDVSDLEMEREPAGLSNAAIAATGVPAPSGEGASESDEE